MAFAKCVTRVIVKRIFFFDVFPKSLRIVRFISHRSRRCSFVFIEHYKVNNTLNITPVIRNAYTYFYEFSLSVRLCTTRIKREKNLKTKLVTTVRRHGD